MEASSYRFPAGPQEMFSSDGERAKDPKHASSLVIAQVLLTPEGR